MRSDDRDSSHPHVKPELAHNQPLADRAVLDIDPHRLCCSGYLKGILAGFAIVEPKAFIVLQCCIYRSIIFLSAFVKCIQMQSMNILTSNIMGNLSKRNIRWDTVIIYDSKRLYRMVNSIFTGLVGNENPFRFQDSATRRQRVFCS